MADHDTGIRSNRSQSSFDWGFLKLAPGSGLGFAVGVAVGAIVVIYAPLQSTTQESPSSQLDSVAKQSEPRQIPVPAAYTNEHGDIYEKDLALARNYANLGSLYFTRGDMERANAMYRNSLTRYEKSGDLAGIADTYTNLGTVHWRRGDLLEAEAMYEKALQINERLGREQKQAHSYANLGVVYQTRGELGRAKDFHYRALRMYEDLDGNAEAMANIYSNLGRLYKSLGDLNRSEALFLNALKLRQSQEPNNTRNITVEFRADAY